MYAENILICIAAPLAITLLFLRGEAKRFVTAFIIGMGVSLLSSYINGFFTVLMGLTANDASVYIAPVFEESMKLLPILFYFFVFVPDDGHLFQFAIAVGAGFATFENCCYLMIIGAERLSFVLVRGLAVGVMHIVCVFAVTLGIVLERRFHSLSFPGILGALSMSSVFHALYNLLVSEPGPQSAVGLALPFLTAMLMFIPFSRSYTRPSDS